MIYFAHKYTNSSVSLYHLFTEGGADHRLLVRAIKITHCLATPAWQRQTKIFWHIIAQLLNSMSNPFVVNRYFLDKFTKYHIPLWWSTIKPSRDKALMYQTNVFWRKYHRVFLNLRRVLIPLHCNTYYIDCFHNAIW